MFHISLYDKIKSKLLLIGLLAYSILSYGIVAGGLTTSAMFFLFEIIALAGFFFELPDVKCRFDVLIKVYHVPVVPAHYQHHYMVRVAFYNMQVVCARVPEHVRGHTSVLFCNPPIGYLRSEAH